MVYLVLSVGAFRPNDHMIIITLIAAPGYLSPVPNVAEASHIVLHDESDGPEVRGVHGRCSLFIEPKTNLVRK